MLTSPYSLTTTAAREKSLSLSRRLTKVVLPLPRKPVTSSTGTRGLCASNAGKTSSLVPALVAGWRASRKAYDADQIDQAYSDYRRHRSGLSDGHLRARCWSAY